MDRDRIKISNNLMISIGHANGYIPANAKRCPNTGLILGWHRRQWANIRQTLGECLVFAVPWHHIQLPWLLSSVSMVTLCIYI